ncbi:flippase-like domain-containing protein, partial [candidate division WWE3 bacterium]|nr:flippase-like domain-containing protein [candidate division WWE3 bacterium]
MINKKLVGKIAVSLLLLSILYFTLDKNSLVLNLSRLNYSYLPVIFALVIMNYFVSSLRWKKLLSVMPSADHVSFGYLFRLYFIGSFFNNFLPTSIGGD